MIRGLGIDAAEVARFERMAEDERFRARVFTQTERDYIDAKGKTMAQSAAACFAAKEAALKALGTGIGPLSLQDIWVEHEDSGRPFLGFSPKAEAKMAELGAEGAHLSITHTAETAIAVVLLEDGRQQKFERMFSDLQKTQERTAAELDALRAAGRAKTVRARELMAKKMLNGAMVALIRSYGI